MATASLLGSATWNTTSGTKTVTATTTVDDLIVIVSAHSGSTTSTAPTDDRDNGGRYTLVTNALKNTSADLMEVWVRNELVRTAGSTVFTTAPGTTTGGGLAVIRISGMQRCAITNVVVQSARQQNQSAGTPAPAFGSACNTNNVVIGAVFNGSNIANLTPRTTPAYTELADLGYNTPATGLQVMAINSGETGTTITWGGASSSLFCSIVVELSTSATPVKALGAMGVG